MSKGKFSKGWSPKGSSKGWSPLSKSGQVNSTILERSAEEILVLVNDETNQTFDFVNLVTALHRIAKTTGSQYSTDPRL